MLLLAIDTSTTAITVGLHDGARVLAEVTTLDARAHAEHLAPGIVAALRDIDAAPADVTDVVVGIGPGPFTGLRVGIVTGRTFAFASGIPVRGLCSLDALAHAAWLGGRRGDLLVATDARRKEVYAAHFRLDDAGLVRVAGPLVDRASDLDDTWRAMPVAGRGALLYPADLGSERPGATEPSGIRDEAGDLPLDVSGGALADLAVRRLALAEPAREPLQRVDPGDGFDGLEPLYLRRPDAAPAPPSTKSTLG